jgi:hypothetical protein
MDKGRAPWRLSFDSLHSYGVILNEAAFQAE